MKNTSPINKLLGVGISSLKKINETNKVSDSCKDAASPILDLMEICYNCWNSQDPSSFPCYRLLLDYCDDIEDCFKTCSILCERILSKSENYFGVFKVTYFDKLNIVDLILMSITKGIFLSCGNIVSGYLFKFFT